MAEPNTSRRRNFQLFSYITSNMSDAELRTMRECVDEELRFREFNRRRRSGMTQAVGDPEEHQGGHHDSEDEAPSSGRIEAGPVEPEVTHRRGKAAPGQSHITSPAGERLVRRQTHGRPPRHT